MSCRAVLRCQLPLSSAPWSSTRRACRHPVLWVAASRCPDREYRGRLRFPAHLPPAALRLTDRLLQWCALAVPHRHDRSVRARPAPRVTRGRSTNCSAPRLWSSTPPAPATASHGPGPCSDRAAEIRDIIRGISARILNDRRRSGGGQPGGFNPLFLLTGPRQLARHGRRLCLYRLSRGVGTA